MLSLQNISWTSDPKILKIEYLDFLEILEIF